jgi:peroxiredoxin Q/BCP
MALRDSAKLLGEFDAAVFMVSLDDSDRNREFAESLEAAHVVLSDPSGATARAYGVADGERRYARRWTFYIDREGVIREIDRDVSVETAGQDIARTLGELGFPRRSSSAPGGDASDR